MSKKNLDEEIKIAKIKFNETKKNTFIKKIHNEDKKVISNFHMIKLSDILQIKENIRTLEGIVKSCDKQLMRLL